MRIWRSSHLRTALGAFLLAVLIIGGSLSLERKEGNKSTPFPPEEPRGRVFTAIGRLVDTHRNPLREAKITLHLSNSLLGEAESQKDGSFTLRFSLPAETYQGSLKLEVKRQNFRPLSREIPLGSFSGEGKHFLELGEMVLIYRQDWAFWFVSASFALTLALIALELLHKTTAALVGALLVLLGSEMASLFNPDWGFLSFERAVQAIDFEVIFLLVGMMIFVAMVEETGFFQWLAFSAYRLARGRPWLLMVILTLLTGVLSAFLDNVTTVLFMSPIVVEISLKLNLNPLTLLIPEVLASNIGGMATLIGDPPNILIGAYAGFNFGDFLVNTGPVALLSLLALVVFMRWRYGTVYRQAEEIDSAVLLQRLREDSRITQPELLRCTAVVGAGMLALFLVGPRLGLIPALTALLGAVVLMVWVRPDVERMVHEVDWTTLLFFMALFIQVSALEEVGVIHWLADTVRGLAGGSRLLAMLLMLWPSALLSGLIDNIPFTATMLPVAAYLTKAVPGGEKGLFFWALSLGVCLGGNATLIASSPNLVTAGIAERAGFPLSYLRFLLDGLPITIISLFIATIWLLVRF